MTLDLLELPQIMRSSQARRTGNVSMRGRPADRVDTQSLKLQLLFSTKGRRQCLVLGAILLAGVLASGCRRDNPGALPSDPRSEDSITPQAPRDTTEADPISSPIADQSSRDSNSNISNPQSENFEFGDPPALALKNIHAGLVNPVDAQSIPNTSSDLMLVAEQAGAIRVLSLKEGPEAELPIALDIREQVNDGASEQGLLGIAPHPDPMDERIFVHYSGQDGQTILSSFRRIETQDETITYDPNSEVVLLEVDQPAGNHNGGQIAFGPDMMLYLGLGDGGGSHDRFQNGQDRSSLLGSILRLDVNGPGSSAYLIPPNNPYVDHPDFRPEIWAFGLRNPWRFSFDRLNGSMFIGDVGQNKWEEISFAPVFHPGGLNYGWPIFEGANCADSDDVRCEDDSAFQAPILEYSQADGPGCSVTGGYVYRGSEEASLYGRYVFGDFCSGEIWTAIPEGSGRWTASLGIDSNIQISSFAQTAMGEILVLDHGSSGGVYLLQVGDEPDQGIE